MRHLLLALPVLALAACGDPCTAPGLTVSWRFDLADGTRDATCTAAGVATLDVWIDGTPVGTGVSCAQGSATFPGLGAGVHNVTIQGSAAGGALVDRDWFNVATGACGETRAVARPGQGDLHVAYNTTTGVCWDLADPAQTSGFMWFVLRDRLLDRVVASVADASPDADKIRYACSADLTFRLPYGDYRLDWIQDVRLPLSVASPAYQYCTATDQTMHATGRTDLAVLLAPSSGAACAP